MKLSFLCGSFVEGKDGVGDYVRRFVSHLTRQGHSCQVISLAEADAIADAPDPPSTIGYEVVRLRRSDWQSGNISAAEQALRRFSPDWTSLQMVSYALEKHGLLFRSPLMFRRLGKFGKRHLMFHELWIGEDETSSIKERLLGLCQKTLLLRAAGIWSPHFIHTSNPVYRELLKRSQVAAAELPLPGNIPVHMTDTDSARRWLLSNLDPLPDSPALIAGIFGSIHSLSNHMKWLELLQQKCSQLGRTLVLVHFGSMGANGRSIWSHMVGKFQGRMLFGCLGELSAHDVSRTMQAMDIGVTTTPWPLTGKSGSVAAMIEHGLPVVAVGKEYRLRRGATPEPHHHPMIHRFDTDFLGKLSEILLMQKDTAPRCDPYESFVMDLAGAEPCAESRHQKPNVF